MATALKAAPDPQAAVDAFLAANQAKSLLRFITCGSVDDGKSTLIGRLLYDSKMLFEDQLSALEADSKRVGTQGQALDFALLVDGLAAEREQGITIDVAYRFFATDKRKFIVADTPGHEQYTRNMVTGASNADAAVILIDARKGVLTQTRRHSFLVNLPGIRNIVLAVNKMDLVGYDQRVFDAIVADYRAFAEQAGIPAFTAIPAAALAGENISERGSAMPWYDGPALLEHLEQVPAAAATTEAPFRMAVQWVNRPNQNFRGYAGQIASGTIRPGDKVVVLPSGGRTTVERVVTMDGDLDQGVAGQSITLTLADEVDCSRGDMISAAFARPRTADRIEAMLVWMAAEPMVPGRAYWLKTGAQTVSASVARVGELVDVNTMVRGAGRPLDLNDIGRCELVLDRPLPALTYDENRSLGGFILIDRATNATVAAGMIQAAVDPSTRTTAGEHGRILWLTGSSGADRIAFARRFAQRLQARGRTAMVLDDDALRRGLNRDLSPADEPERQRRIRELARLLSENGLVVLVAADMPDADREAESAIDVTSGDYAGDWVI